MILSYCSVLILFICLQLETGFCEISKESPKGRNPATADEPEEELVGTITWPFADSSFEDPIQSPVDIITSIIQEKDNLPPLTIYEPLDVNTVADVYNSGKTAVVYIKEHDRNKLPYLSGGPLNDKFYFEQMHFHWGSSDIWGSEHFVDGEAFCAEIHMVHFNGRYSDFSKATSKTDGLAVLTVFVKSDNKDNPLLEPLHKLLNELQTPHVHKELHWSEAMQWAISGITSNPQYYAYPGSLTTKPYSQNVAFIILPKPITISHDQLTAFRNLYRDESKERILENKRNLQPLNHRPIIKGVVNVEIDKSATRKTE